MFFCLEISIQRVLPSCRSVVSTLRALFCLSWMIAALWALCSWTFPSGLYYVVPPMMLPFLLGVALDYDIFYVEAVLEQCRSGSTPKDASISALNQTANTITAAGIIMIIAFVPLLLSSTLVMRQIGFMAVAGLVISSAWSTKVVAPLWLQLLDSHSFWPRRLRRSPWIWCSLRTLPTLWTPSPSSHHLLTRVGSHLGGCMHSFHSSG